MDDPKLKELRKVVGELDKLVYEAVKAGMVAELPHEHQFLARAIEEHLHLKHVHNALEFADLREGEPYEVTVDGNPVSPLAHLTLHAAVKGQVEEDPQIRAACEKMVATGTSAHHAEHVLSAMLAEVHWEMMRAAEVGPDTEKALAIYKRKLKKLDRDAVFRRKIIRKFSADHFAFE
jgi:hypothetical protein